MSDNVKELETKLEQCTRDIGRLQDEQLAIKQRLEDAKKPKRKWQHGDVFINPNYSMGSKVRIIIRNGSKWVLASDDGNQAFGETYEEVCKYINDRIPGKRPNGDSYVYQYNLFERKV